MGNTVTWDDPDTTQKATGGTHVASVYLIDPTTQKAISPASAGSGTTDVVATGNITAAQASQGTPVANATVVLALGTGQATWEAQITGLGSGSTVAFDGVDDTSTSTNWQAAVGYNASVIDPTPITSIAGPGPFIIRGSSSGYEQIRIRCTVYNGTDTIAVRLIGSTGSLAGLGGLVSNDGTFAKETGGNLATLAGTVSGGNVKVSVQNANTNGQATMANSAPVAIASNQSAIPIGVVAGTSLVADQTNTELRTSTYVKTTTAGDTALTLGQAAMANSLPVTVASDQTPKTSATATRTNVVSAASDTSLLASNTSRKGAIFFNDSTAILYLAYGSGAASTSSYSVQVPANGYFELPPEPIFTGAIRGIWSAANGNVRITEMS